MSSSSSPHCSFNEFPVDKRICVQVLTSYFLLVLNMQSWLVWMVLSPFLDKEINKNKRLIHTVRRHDEISSVVFFHSPGDEGGKKAVNFMSTHCKCLQHPANWKHLFMFFFCFDFCFCLFVFTNVVSVRNCTLTQCCVGPWCSAAGGPHCWWSYGALVDVPPKTWTFLSL